MWRQLITDHRNNAIFEDKETLHRPRRGAYVWLDVLRPEEAEKKEILARFFPFHSVDMGRSKHPQVELNTDYLFFTMYRLKKEETGIQRSKIAFYLGQSFLMTVHEEPVPEIDAVWSQNLRETLLQKGGESALYQLLGKLVAEYETIRNGIADDYEALHESVTGWHNKHFLNDLLELRKKAHAVRQEIRPHIRALRLLKSERFPYVDDPFSPFFADLFERALEVDEDLHSMLESLVGAIQAYTSIQANVMNEIMKILTIISTIFLPATLIASIYGMNFHIPEYSWSFGYYYALGLMAAVISVSLFYMRWKRWI
jgi:magnesium transporter